MLGRFKVNYKDVNEHRSGVFIANYKHTYTNKLVLLLLTLNMSSFNGVPVSKMESLFNANKKLAIDVILEF